MGSESCIYEAVIPNVRPKGWDHRSRPWTYLEGGPQEEMLLDRYQVLNWNLERMPHPAAFIAFNRERPPGLDPWASHRTLELEVAQLHASGPASFIPPSRLESLDELRRMTVKGVLHTQRLLDLPHLNSAPERVVRNLTPPGRLEVSHQSPGLLTCSPQIY